MYDCRLFYIDGEWRAPQTPNDYDVIDPATEASIGTVSLGSAADVDRAVKAARTAFESYSRTSREERLDLLERVLGAYKKRYAEIARAISDEMGAPMTLARNAQAAMGIAHLQTAMQALKGMKLQWDSGKTRIVREPIGACGFNHPVELAHQPDRLQGRARTGRRLHHGAQAQRDSTAERFSLRPGDRRGRRSERRLQPGQRRRADRRSGDRRASRSGHGVVHGIDPRRRGWWQRPRPTRRQARGSQELGGKSAEHHPCRMRSLEGGP